MSAPDRIVIAGGWGECGNYYPNATEAEGEHGGVAIEYIRADLVPQWMPIETAPRDGARVLVYSENCIAIAGYSTDYNSWCENYYDNLWHDPTHWQPLPSPPPAT